ncbi:MAG: hypothetical protein EZS28_017411 [Streblomastix strix]|uniref:Uncharacterized protein n=1 Tax=Streblomastix strix TaxID=222440 RepID=A0A5J4VXJ5_9EUKA|nr:MAG: hypothetical protein EZS28_017411 [Streblomastix strix]
MKLQHEDVQTYISILKENILGILAVLISNVDESGFQAFLNGGDKHFLVPISIAQDVSSYGVDRAEGIISVCAGITLSDECIKPLIAAKGDMTEQDLLHQGIVQGKQAVICSSGSGNIYSDLFVRWLKECYFPDLDAKRVAIKQGNALSIQLTNKCEICTTDQPLDFLSFSVLKRSINQSRGRNQVHTVK